MDLGAIITTLIALLVGGVCGIVSTNMTSPGSDAFKMMGIFIPAGIGLVVGIIAAFFGAPLYALVVHALIGLLTGYASMMGARAFKGR